MENLHGKTALVTGGGTGIGLAIATALRAAGASVVITGRREDVLAEAAAAHDLIPQPMDVTEEASVEAAFAPYPRIDICVANAGIAEGQTIRTGETAHYRRIMATNLDGTWFTLRAALRKMDPTWGRVIAVSSIAGVRGLKGAHAYTASKHGVVGLIRGLAVDYTGTGITLNALCPGYVDTAIIAQNITRITARTGMSDADARQVMLDANPSGRLIAPEDVAAAALWLCGDGSGSVTGQAIELPGGLA